MIGLKEIEDLAKELHKTLSEREHESLANRLKNVCSVFGINLKETEVCLCGHPRRYHCKCGECCQENVYNKDVDRDLTCSCVGYLQK